jgi:energy-converting hydrogenase Eha subunit A
VPENISSKAPIRDRWSIRLALLAIPVLVMGVNALAVSFIDALSSVMIETAIQVQINSLTSMQLVRFLNEVFPFILTIVVLTWYMFPVYRAFWNGSPAQSNAVRPMMHGGLR